MNAASKILIAAPVSDAKSYILFKWIDHIKQYNCDVLLVDNSRTKQLSRVLKKMGVMCIHRPPLKNERLPDVIAACNNAMLRYFLKNNYTHYFSIECDVFPPKDIINRLLAHNLPVASGSYFIGHKGNTKPMIQQLSHTRIVSFVTVKQGFLDTTNQLLRVYSSGMGCLLIQRNVFINNGIIFRTTPQLEAFPDSYFTKDLNENGVPIYIDTAAICEHYPGDWNKVKKKFNSHKLLTHGS